MEVTDQPRPNRAGHPVCPCGFDEPHGTAERERRHKAHHLATFPDVDARTIAALDDIIRRKESE